MAIHATFSRVNREVLRELEAMDEEQIADRLFDLRESGDIRELGGSREFNLGSAWDGLHFLLTGSSGTHPIIDNALSEAIVGRERLVDDGALFVSVLRREHLPVVNAALGSIPEASVTRTFRRSRLVDAGIFPQEWFATPSTTVVEVFRLAFVSLRLFLAAAERDQFDVIVECG